MHTDKIGSLTCGSRRKVLYAACIELITYAVMELIVSGFLLGSLLHEIGNPSVGDPPGTVEGLLMGHRVSSTGTTLNDGTDDEKSAFCSIIADSFVRTGRRNSFYDERGHISKKAINTSLGNDLNLCFCVGVFVSRVIGPLMPSMREYEALRCLALRVNELAMKESGENERMEEEHFNVDTVRLALLLIRPPAHQNNTSLRFTYAAFCLGVDNIALVSIPCCVRSLTPSNSTAEYLQFASPGQLGLPVSFNSLCFSAQKNDDLSCHMISELTSLVKKIRGEEDELLGLQCLLSAIKQNAE